MMRSLKKTILALAALIVAASGFSQEVRSIRIAPDDIHAEQSNGFATLSIDCLNSTSTRVGEPALPVYRETFWGGDDASIEVISDSSCTIAFDQVLLPLQPSLAKDSAAVFDYGYINAKRTGYYGGGIPKICRIGKRGNNTLWQIEICPIEYAPIEHSLRIHNIQYRIHSAAPEAKPTQGLPKYQIVTPAAFESTLQELATWRRQCGYLAGITYSDGLAPDSIRAQLNRIQPDYVLIVGDIGVVGSFSGRQNINGLNSHYADLYFGEYTNDYLPEALVGRLAVNDTIELQNVVKKILDYERCINLPNNHKALVVAGREGSSPAPTTTNGQVNYVSERLASAIDTICYRNPESFNLRDSIISNLNQGLDLINYTSHCDINGWKFPQITINEIDSSTLPSIWINNCCESNRFGSTCFGERLLRMPHGGAVGVIGAGNETFWNEDYFWSVGAKRPISLYPSYDSIKKGAFDRLLDHEISNLGEMLMAGNMAVTQSGSPYDGFYWEIYCLLGDPATQPHIGSMAQASANCQLHIGDIETTVSGTPNAKVTLVQNDILLGCINLDANGSGNMTLACPLINAPCLLTATGLGLIPSIDTIIPQQVEGARIAATIINRDDNIAVGERKTMSIIFQSIGTDTAFNHWAQIMQTSEDSNYSILSSIPNIAIPSVLAPEESDTTHIEIAIANNIGNRLSIHLVIGDSDGAYFNQQIHWSAIGNELADELIWKRNGVAINELLPNKDYQLEVPPHTSNWDGQELHQLIITAVPTNGSSQFFFEPNQSATFNYPTPTALQRIRTDFVANNDTMTRWWNAGVSVEDFEDTLHYPLQSSTLSQWQIDSSEHHSGRWGMRSGQVEKEQCSDLTLEINVEADDTLSFWCKTSCQAETDYLQFFIDGRRQYYWSGIKDWKEWSTPIARGQHTLKWRYVKNSTNSSGSDCVWIDDIRLPFASWDQPYGNPNTLSDTSLSINETFIPQWSIYPNPAQNELFIETDEDAMAIIFDLAGREIGRIAVAKGKTTQYCTNQLRYGIYLMKLVGESGSSVKKLIISH